MEILQKIVDFSEYMNFKGILLYEMHVVIVFIHKLSKKINISFKFYESATKTIHNFQAETSLIRGHTLIMLARTPTC